MVQDIRAQSKESITLVVCGFGVHLLVMKRKGISTTTITLLSFCQYLHTQMSKMPHLNALLSSAVSAVTEQTWFRQPSSQIIN
jgi:hypothetical protein